MKMKRILITGKNSYVGNSLEKWLGNYPEKYKVDKISLRDKSWILQDFSIYDVILNVAGIAHIKETKENEQLYYQVNRDLAYEVTKKAKRDGVGHFIFLSSMSVYGIETGVIDKKTPPSPNSNYGKSKLQAEQLIKSLEDEKFKIAIIRPPMIYGKDCKGNYPRLSNFALRAPIFPSIENERSMIFIDNLCEFIRLVIDQYDSGLFFPQNKDYVCTSEMVKLINEVNGKKIRMTKLLNPLLNVINNRLTNKVFGNLVYEKEMSAYKGDYQIKDFRGSIESSKYWRVTRDE